MLSNSGTASNGIVQSLNFEDKLSFRRSTMSFLDQLKLLAGEPPLDLAVLAERASHLALDRLAPVSYPARRF